jgi:hypothetical protein
LDKIGASTTSVVSILICGISVALDRGPDRQSIGKLVRVSPVEGREPDSDDKI